METIPHVVKASHIFDFKIEIVFNDGTKGVVDLARYPLKGGVFEPLSNLDYFKKFFIDLNTLCWPNGADIAPERLYEQVMGQGTEISISAAIGREQNEKIHSLNIDHER